MGVVAVIAVVWTIVAIPVAIVVGLVLARRRRKEQDDDPTHRPDSAVRADRAGGHDRLRHGA